MPRPCPICKRYGCPSFESCVAYTHARRQRDVHHFVNVGPEHMPLGPADHLIHLQRLAARGERDES